MPLPSPDVQNNSPTRFQDAKRASLGLLPPPKRQSFCASPHPPGPAPHSRIQINGTGSSTSTSNTRIPPVCEAEETPKASPNFGDDVDAAPALVRGLPRDTAYIAPTNLRDGARPHSRSALRAPRILLSTRPKPTSTSPREPFRPSPSLSPTYIDITTDDATNNPPPGNRPTTICVYDWKGGNSESWLTVLNLAAVMSRAGKRVLCVDADPKCRLSRFLLPSDELDASASDGSDGSQAVSQIPDDSMLITGVSGLSDNVSLKRAHERTTTYTGWPNNLFSLLDPYIRPTSSMQPALPTLENLPGRNNLFLIPGSPRVMEFDDELPGKQIPTGSSKQLGAFRYVIREVAQKSGIDIVLVDLGPGIGAANKLFVLSCDYILPLAGVDGSSLTFTQIFIKQILPVWYKWHKRAREAQFRELSKCDNAGVHELMWKFCLSLHPPSVLPLLLIGYRTDTPSGANSYPDASTLKQPENMSASYCRWMNGFVDLMRALPVVHVSKLPDFGSLVVPFLRRSANDQEAATNRKAIVEMDFPERENGASIVDRTERFRRFVTSRYQGLAEAIWKLHCAENSDQASKGAMD